MTTTVPLSRFGRRLGAGVGELRAAAPTTLQVNVGKRCNQACRHCHVDASPTRTEVMPDDVLEAQVAAIDKVYEVEAQKNPFFARVLKSQKDFASRAVPHAQKIRPPIEVSRRTSTRRANGGCSRSSCPATGPKIAGWCGR